MANGAEQPDLFGIALGDLGGKQIFIQGQMPQLGDFRVGCRNIIKPGKHLIPGAVGAASSAYPRIWGSLPGMAKFAPPPVTIICFGKDFRWPLSVVFFIIPLRCDITV